MTTYQQTVETLLSQGFIAKTDKNGVYDHGVLGMKVEFNLIKLCEKVKEDAALEAKPGRIEVEEVEVIRPVLEKLNLSENNLRKVAEALKAIGEDKEEAKKMKAALELQEDEIKDEVNCRNDKNIEELNGLKIHEDANGNSSNYVDLYVEDVETGKVYSVLNLISELGIHTMDELTKLSVKEVVDLIPTAIRHTLGNPYRISSFYNASKDPIKTKAAPPPAPPQCLFRFEESKQVVYTVNPSDKSGYLVDKKLWAPMYKHNSEPISFQNAISEGIVRKIVAYGILKVYEFYKSIGMSENLRFTQGCQENWAAEVECAGGWIECTKFSVKEDAALEAKPGRIEVEEVEVIRPVLEKLNLSKNNLRKVAEALKAIGEDKEEAKKMKAALELQEDEIKDEVNCRNDKNIEELNGLKIHEDANGNSSNYVDLYVEDVETGKVYSVLNLIAELGIRTMDELTKLTVNAVVDLIPTAIRDTLGNPYRISPFYNASKGPIKTKTAPPPALPQSLFRFKESKQLVYTVNHSDKSGYLVDEKLWAPIYKNNSEPISFQNAISEGIVSKVVAYSIAKVYEFYQSIGMSKNLRFTQGCQENWAAEVECAGGWIECTKFSVKEDAALEVIRPVLEKLNLSKNNLRKVAEALEAIGEDKEEAKKMKAALDSKGEYKLNVGTLQTEVTIKPDMIVVTKKKKPACKRESTRYVTQVSFMIGPIIWCLYEHSFDTRKGKDGKSLNLFLFPPVVAPYKCSVIINKKCKTDTAGDNIKSSLGSAGIPYMSVTQDDHLYKSFITSDEYGCPFAVVVNSEDWVKIRNRDERGTEDEYLYINAKDAANAGQPIMDVVAQLIQDLVNGKCKWKDACQKYISGTKHK